MRSKQTGATAVEFALLLPFFLLLIDAVIEFSMLMYDYSIVSNAAREAVRAGVVVKTPKLSDNEIRNIALSYAQNYLLTFNDLDHLSVDVIQSQDGAYQTPLTVKVSFTYTSLLGGSFLSAIKEPVVLVGIATQLNE